MGPRGQEGGRRGYIGGGSTLKENPTSQAPALSLADHTTQLVAPTRGLTAGNALLTASVTLQHPERVLLF